jgi:CSLREA domain-containing protein
MIGNTLKSVLTRRLPWLGGLVLVGLVLGVWLAPVAYGANIVVNSTEDTSVPGDGACTLREAINNANTDSDTTGGDCVTGSGADTMSFSVTGTIRLGSELPAISQDLTISGPGQANLTISGDTNNDGTGDVPILTVNSGVAFTLESLTVAKGVRSSSGGGISNFGTLYVTNSTFSGNIARSGGGIFNDSGTLNVSNSTFSSNSAPGTLAIGGGIYNSGGTLTVSNSTFSGNSSTFFGGGISNSGTLAVSNSTFSGNSGGTFGGGGISNSGTLAVSNSNFSGNSGNAGGGILQNGGTLTVTNSTFSGNSGNGGGGIYKSGGTLTVTNSTFSGNSASGFGGGIHNAGGSTTLRNTIVANSPSGGNCSGPITDGGGNLRWPNTDLSCVGAFGDPKLGPLANNGGPTQTMALLASSAAIDAGVNSTCAAPPVNNLDQRGQPRPVDGNSDGTATCDIGAYELQIPFPPLETTPPRCALTAVIPGPPKQFEITVQERDSGLAAINVLVAQNFSVTIPPFAAGARQVVVTATKIDQSMRAEVVLEVIDVAGNKTTCGPVRDEAGSP